MVLIIKQIFGEIFYSNYINIDFFFQNGLAIGAVGTFERATLYHEYFGFGKKKRVRF